MKELSYKQQAFVEAYLKSFNATQSALEAGYSQKTAYAQGHRLLKNAEITARVRARMTEAAMSADEVLFHLAQIARGNMDDLVDANGSLDLEKARRLGKSPLIRKVRSRTIVTEQSDITETEVEPYDRLKALELLAKYHDLTNRVRVEVDWRIQLLEDVQTGVVQLPMVIEAFGDKQALMEAIGEPSLATRLFTAAGLSVQDPQGEGA